MIPPPRPGPASGHERTNAVGNPTPDRKRPPAARLSLRLLRLAVYCALWPLSRLAASGLSCRHAGGSFSGRHPIGHQHQADVNLHAITHQPSRDAPRAEHVHDTRSTRVPTRPPPGRARTGRSRGQRREREGFGDRIAPRMSMWNGERTFFPFYCARITCDVPPSSMPSADPSHGPSSSSCANTNAFALE